MSIECRGRLIEDQDGRRLEDGPGDCHALLFATRKLQAALADHGFIALGKALDEFADLGDLGSLLDLLRGGLKGGRSECYRQSCR